MITTAGIRCDVCGLYILPIFLNELAHPFTIAQMPGVELHCDSKCKQAILDAGGDWQKLPNGPLRKSYEEAAAKIAANN